MMVAPLFVRASFAGWRSSWRWSPPAAAGMRLPKRSCSKLATSTPRTGNTPRPSSHTATPSKSTTDAVTTVEARLALADLNLDTVRQEFDGALSLDPASFDALRGQIRADLALHNTTRAVATIDEPLKKLPKNPARRAKQGIPASPEVDHTLGGGRTSARRPRPRKRSAAATERAFVTHVNAQRSAGISARGVRRPLPPCRGRLSSPQRRCAETRIPPRSGQFVPTGPLR